ncbi:hypothetical protein GKZ68_10495 [Hymenobacter sp. BRD128]|uniref:hypothetical protein n=1 Tax=Hymenobacter sp. BRD128 TaxID=2675878 RepID=UPI001566054A|nr:hypothetical protein [Hymenobacter sp. BRD128]QKG57018.1 hypothetical protein GKZ68_10495 [Hymenobacter sp. BRD128]
MPNVPRYRVDFARLALLLLPSLLRRPRLLALCQWLLTPVATLYARFISYEAYVRRELSYNSQVLLFEEALNDHYDAAVRRIYITNTDVELQPVYVNFVAENQPNPALYFVAENQPPVYLFNWVEFSQQADFIVHAPAILRPKASQLHAAIKRLKLANKHYLLVFF